MIELFRDRLTAESHVVVAGERIVRLSVFGWFAAAVIGSSVGLLAVSLTILSMRGIL